MRVGLFDSGMGGVTVLKKLMLKYPNNEYIYYGDNLNVPYGNKSVEELLKLANDNVNFLLSHNVDMIIVACGTISSNCFNQLVNKYDVPIYDIISPTIDYLNNSNYKNILVIGTKRTIDSHIFKDRLSKNVIEVETPELATLIEENNFDNMYQILHRYLDDYRDKIDALVLGCTHYPLITSYISDVLPNVSVIDMADNVSIYDGHFGGVEIYFSKVDEKVIKNVKRILNNDTVLIHNVLE